MPKHARDCRAVIDERGLGRAGKRSKRVGLGRPVEIAERPGKPVEMVLRAVVVPVDGVGRAHEASDALVSFMRRSISAIACVIWARRRSLVVAASCRSSSV